MATGAGSGFAGTFTISGGGINSITVTNPGRYAGASPNIIMSSGGTGCAGYTLYPTLSDSILNVVRGSLGSTVAAHNAGAKVFTVLWASQYDVKRPGKRYNFRIAAYNNAGLSEWLYYDLKLYNVFPRRLASKGNIPMEIILVGAGITSANFTVYIGHTLPDGKIDLARSKECTGLMVLDTAGTKLAARSAAWVGKAHDLIVHYRSGIFEQFVVGNNWIAYDAPTVSTVMPALLDNGAAANVTVMGASFGNNRSDVWGYLDGASTIQCTPFTLINDGLGICTLVPAKDDVLTGNIIVVAGSDWSGGAQQSSARLSNYVKEKPLPVEVEVSLPIEISTIPEGSREREAVKASFTADLSKALGVPSWRISITELRAGSVIIVFVILPDASSVSALTPAALAVELAQQAADPNSALRKTSTGSSITVSVPSNLAAVLLAESVISSATASSTKTKKKVALSIDYNDPNRLERWEKWQSTANLH